MTELERSLQALGFNLLEAQTYVALLGQREPVTAYRLARELGKPTANVYKAIQSLALKGAVSVEEGESRLCRAASPEELFRQLQRELRRHTEEAGRLLADLTPAAADERVYQLRSVPLVLERATAMLGSAERIAVLDAFPAALDAVLPAVREAVARGVEVFVQAYRPPALVGAEVVVAHQSEEILAYWRSEQLNLVIDGREMLLALLAAELAGVHQAVWSDSLYLSCMLHAGFLREHVFHAVLAEAENVELPPAVRRQLDRQPLFHTDLIPGQRRLFARLRIEPEEKP